MGVRRTAAERMKAANAALRAEVRRRRAAETELRRSAREIQRYARRLLAVREEEKRNLAAALHHELGSLSVGLAAGLHAARLALPPGAADARQRLEETEKILRGTVSRLRDTAVDLRPADLDTVGLKAALHATVERLSRLTPVRIRLGCRLADTPLSPSASIAVYRIAQEALTNCLKHASPRRISLDVRVREDTVRLSATDDGRGFDPARTGGRGADRHLGLKAMREMVRSLGGEFDLHSKPGRGTRLQVRLPADGNGLGGGE